MKFIGYFILFIAVFCGCNSAKYSNLNDGIYAEIKTNKGDILVKLFADEMPMTVANFVSLAEGTNTKLPDSLKGKNFYDGLLFHRVVRNFVIQGGGYATSGRKKTGFLFADEFPNKKNNDLLYRHNDKGIISMSNTGPNTNNSQFFITHRAIPHLDGKHAVFGKTILNSKQLKKLKNKIKDSLLLKKSIDSIRMMVVNNIVENDIINTIKIIRIGNKAKNFNAAVVFDTKFKSFEILEKEQKIAVDLIEKARYDQYLLDKKKFLAEMNEPQGIKTNSGLRILKLVTNPKGAKVVNHKPITVNYTIYVADGKKIQSSLDTKTPLVFTLNDSKKPMITGFKEGVLTLRQGEKARLFIPYYIGYGSEASGPFPKKSDLVFEVEILKVGE